MVKTQDTEKMRIFLAYVHGVYMHLAFGLGAYLI